MNDIYKYMSEEFNPLNVMERVSDISIELEEERSKEQEERDERKEFELIYRQFVQGLKLSTGFNRF